jgi:membrane protein DedA with SNARE-associated domain
MSEARSQPDADNTFDVFIRSRAAQVVAFWWGLAEATFFFFVPDVWLSMLACRHLKSAFKATWMALAGALLGGALMYFVGLQAADAARAFLNDIPAINPALMDKVQQQIARRSVLALLQGPLLGIPYKIYAVEWGANARDFTAFLLISIPARYIRFVLTTITFRAIAHLLQRWTQHNLRIELSLYAAFWIIFYGFYFRRMGW